MPPSRTPPKAEYYRLAAQFEALARSAKTELEKLQYLVRAARFHRLGNARFEKDNGNQHFPKRAV